MLMSLNPLIGVPTGNAAGVGVSFVETNDIRSQLDDVAVGKTRWRGEGLSVQGNPRAGAEVLENEATVTLPGDFRVFKSHFPIHGPDKG